MEKSKGYISEGGYLRPLETPAGYLARGDGLWLSCGSRQGDGRLCRHNKPMDMTALVAKGWGDVPIDALVSRMRCEVCGSRRPSTTRTQEARGAAPPYGGF